MIISKTLKGNTGFTLVETLVAISILLIAVVGPISLIGDALHKLYYAKDQMIAINLAQEGIEVVRQVRDSNMLSLAAQNIFTIGSPAYFVVSANATPPYEVSAGTQQPVLISSDGFYVQGVVGSPTPFKRLVTITSVNGGSIERKVTSTVTWQTGGQTGTITVTEYLFKWAI